MSSRYRYDISTIFAGYYGTAGLDVDLGAFHVELCTGVTGGSVQSNELRSQEISESYK